ncbi:hypothetical protein [Marivirga harenae]|uniref:hypothetical protein n=1 Tax=Marivirga harenae TaxID=2010992 RepID=UPI0026DF886F|nr:hypothetical protein [Marivirga harenae]WKV11778.1 hypothetical protein Q3Y49_16370 [Marivirga harenae]|tara:strand:+ start:17406 stop:17957 length:552 start_codon:yes stop_codon:yes gene_type:complete
MSKGKDKLEQFTKEHREELEIDFNLEVSWNHIEDRISQNKRSKFSIWMVAASIMLVLSVGWLIFDRIQLTNKINELENLSVNDKPYSEIEAFYKRNINEKALLVHQLTKKRNIRISSDLKSLNKKYEDLKLKIKKQGAHPQLVNAMIQNLQTQIEILEQQLNILQDLQEYSHNDKQESNEISI